MAVCGNNANEWLGMEIKMKTLATICVFLLMAGAANAAEKVNSKESLRICKEAMLADVEAGQSFKFKRNTATSVESEKFKHWINATQLAEGEKKSLKVKCETTRSGELLKLVFEPGRWKI